jgi:hypothetical protein
MRKKFWMFMMVLVLVLSVLSACNGGEEKKVEEPNVPQALDVKLDVPETADVNGKVEMKVAVTQGGEKVTDADEVKFEVWEEGKKEESSMIEAENKDDGTYEAETSFDHDGVFTVQVHVTARGLHTMPKKSVTVGAGAGHEEEQHDHGHGEKAKGFSMHFTKPDGLEAGNETKMTVHLQNEDAPLEKAQVRYEIWNDSISEKHEWVETEEAGPGEYTAVHTFTEAGTYMVQIHVESDDGLHEHEEHQVEVKNEGS